MATKETSLMLDQGHHVCSICGKPFFALTANYVYQTGSGVHHRWFCSWTCMRQHEKEAKASWYKKIEEYNRSLGRAPKEDIPVGDDTIVQWNRFHYAWLEDNANKYKDIPSFIKAFNKQFLVNVKPNKFKAVLEKLDLTNIDELPKTVQWNRFHWRWIKENEGKYNTLKELHQAFNKEFILDTSYQTFLKAKRNFAEQENNKEK